MKFLMIFFKGLQTKHIINIENIKELYLIRKLKLDQIDHDEYREPFIGGGSVYINKPNVEFNWINDLDKDLYSFYKIISKPKDREKLIEDFEQEFQLNEWHKGDYK